MWQDNSRSQVLKETVFFKCTHCGIIPNSFFDTNDISQTKHTEVNLLLVQTGLVAGNGLSSLRKVCSISNLPEFLANKNYNKILRHIAKESIEETEIVLKKPENFKKNLEANAKFLIMMAVMEHGRKDMGLILSMVLFS